MQHVLHSEQEVGSQNTHCRLRSGQLVFPSHWVRPWGIWDSAKVWARVWCLAAWHRDFSNSTLRAAVYCSSAKMHGGQRLPNCQLHAVLTDQRRQN